MTLPLLTIIPAGAGSGKTYTIQKTLADWVVSGEVRPDRIVAVTFTEAAAAEMRDRIRTELTTQGRLEDALLLEQSYISTIHAFGLRIVTEFAFDCGLSPSPRLLNEDEEASLMRRALVLTDRADEVMDDLGGFGYSYDFTSGKGAEELFRSAVLKLIATLRSIGRLQEDPLLLPHAERMIRDLYGATLPAVALEDELHRAVINLLKKYPRDLTDEYGGNDTAIKALRQNYRDLKQAELKTPLATDWSLWQRLRKLRTTGMPGEYAVLADEVVSAAGELPRHPGPLEDALRHTRALLGTSQDALDRHREKKREKGLLDYTDMLALTHSLLTENPDALEQLRQQIDCLIIDEFQDTNPLQFSLLWKFQALGVPTLIVGDLKQAIMGFQNADSRLLEALMERHPKLCRPLESNWRSTPQLMAWINRLGTGLFREQYTPLVAKADFPSLMTPLEVVSFTGRPKKACIQPRETACRIKAMLDTGTETVYDRITGRQRILKGGDIALLCPTNLRVERYAEALRSQGVAVRMAQTGWFESRIIQLAYYALSFIADPADRHAALYLAVTELGSCTLESALKQLLDGELPDDAVLTVLLPLCELPPDLAVSVQISAMIDALALYERIMAWPDAEQARANLLRLQHEARQFQEIEADALAAGGYYGSGMKTFLAWLKSLAEQEELNDQPEPMVIDEDAVELVTWHRSKGREWPVVVVAGLEASVSPRLPSFNVVYDDFSRLDELLEYARIEISPEFAAPESCEHFAGRLEAEIITGAYRLLYVALTRAREKLVLEWPEYLKTSKAKAPTYWSLLRTQTGMALTGTTLVTAGVDFACRVVTADLAEDDGDSFVQQSAVPLKTYGLRAVLPGYLPELLTPDTVSPSLLHKSDKCPDLAIEIFSYHSTLDIAEELEPAKRGILLHRCFEHGARNALNREQASLIYGYHFTQENWAALQTSMTAFYNLINEHFRPLATFSELPLLYLDDRGSVISGVMDMLLECEAGFWIIDHKSDQCDEFDERFISYMPQLNCYADAAGKVRTDKPVLGVAIHWLRYGIVSVCRNCNVKTENHHDTTITP